MRPFSKGKLAWVEALLTPPCPGKLELRDELGALYPDTICYPYFSGSSLGRASSARAAASHAGGDYFPFFPPGSKGCREPAASSTGQDREGERTCWSLLWHSQ